MMQLTCLLEHTVEGGLRCEINSLVQQVRHDLARWQLAVGRTVAQLDNLLLLRRCQLVGRDWSDRCGALVVLHNPVAIPATVMFNGGIILLTTDCLRSSE